MYARPPSGLGGTPPVAQVLRHQVDTMLFLLRTKVLALSLRKAGKKTLLFSLAHTFFYRGLAKRFVTNFSICIFSCVFVLGWNRSLRWDGYHVPGVVGRREHVLLSCGIRGNGGKL